MKLLWSCLLTINVWCCIEGGILHDWFAASAAGSYVGYKADADHKLFYKSLFKYPDDDAVIAVKPKYKIKFIHKYPKSLSIIYDNGIDGNYLKNANTNQYQFAKNVNFNENENASNNEKGYGSANGKGSDQIDSNDVELIQEIFRAISENEPRQSDAYYSSSSHYDDRQHQQQQGKNAGSQVETIVRIVYDKPTEKIPVHYEHQQGYNYDHAPDERHNTARASQLHAVFVPSQYNSNERLRRHSSHSSWRWPE